jgi:hypothetical protein
VLSPLGAPRWASFWAGILSRPAGHRLAGWLLADFRQNQAAGWPATASECGITSTEVRNRSAWLAAGWQAASSWHADTYSTRHDRQ